jgi:hypothetical protein
VRSLPRIETDVLVIGQGLSGLMCSWMLSQKDIGVAIVGKGTSASEMSTGCVSFPSDGKLSSLLDIEQDDEIWAGEIAEGLFSSMMDKIKNPYFGSRETSVKVLSNNGLGLRTNLAPRFTFQSSEDEISGKKLGVLGIEDIASLDANLFARLASRTTKIEVKSKELNRGAREEIDTVRSSTSSSSREMVENIAKALKEYDEISEPATPLSLPGQRMCRAMERTVLGSGVLSLSGRRLSRLRVDDAGTIDAMISSGLRVQEVRAKTVIHCGGGIVSGGLELEGSDPKDPLGFLDVVSSNDVHRDSKVERALGHGFRVDAKLHAYSKGERLKNVLVAGSALPGANHVQGYGSGAAMTTACLAARYALEGLN